MPYIPPTALSDTAFPTGNGSDLATSIALIREAWQVHYPLITYYPLDKRVTPVAGANSLSGEAGSTKFDPMYGESIDATQGTWRQAHGTAGSVKASNVEVYRDPVQVHAQVQRITNELDMTKLGFDDNDKLIGGLVLTIPSAMLDDLGVTCVAGDKFIWDGDQYKVQKPHQTGYWMNTNVRLYVRLTSERKHQGS